jgi:hypothetical protein
MDDNPCHNVAKDFAPYLVSAKSSPGCIKCKGGSRIKGYPLNVAGFEAAALFQAKSWMIVGLLVMTNGFVVKENTGMVHVVMIRTHEVSYQTCRNNLPTWRELVGLPCARR